MNKKKLNRKLVVRVTEEQWKNLQLNIFEEKVTISQFIREVLNNKLNKIQIDDTKQRKFRL